jgi:hypothetical protein
MYFRIIDGGRNGMKNLISRITVVSRQKVHGAEEENGLEGNEQIL